MKFTDKLKQAFFSAIIFFQAIIYVAIIFLQLNYPAKSWLQMVAVAIISIALLTLVIAAGFKTGDQITTKTGGGLPPDDDEKDKP